MKKSEFLIRQIDAVFEDTTLVDYKNLDNLITILVINYQLMVASENLLKIAIERSEGGLKEYFIKHYDEERGHVEWLDRDLTSVGVDVTKLPLITGLVEMAGSQYYHLYHGDTATILGYLAVLEAYPMPMELVERLESIHGKDVMRTMRYHAEHDTLHRLELFDIIDKVDNTLMINNAIRVQTVLCDIFNSMFHVDKSFEESVKQWVAERTGCEITDKTTAIGSLNKKGDIIAGAVYNHYTGKSISSTFAVADRKGLTKRFIKDIFKYPFEQLGVDRIINYVAESNIESRKITEKFGFVHDVTIQGVYPDGNMMVYTMSRENCKWLDY